ncbi:hypothetical protein JOD54_003145 [Actinokineospora baliensis]|uniref:hypothetical protein n=1 Tax=Actinokineospora baliensis TaxID=547056 RepID=UPI00195B03BB|nr:hypothetical protein [Actinokineospora baliensis]MBM7772941.1 hypothetical protein [Actinokineospora baliensis]
MRSVRIHGSSTELVAPDLFSRVAVRVAASLPHVSHLAERIVDRALAFLAAAAQESGGGLVPSEMVDLGWIN